MGLLEVSTGRTGICEYSHEVFQFQCPASLNVLTVSLLEEKGYDPIVYRFFCLQSHYRKGLVFSWENLDNAVTAFNKLIARIAALKPEGEVEQEAFDTLRRASSSRNVKVRVLAEEIVGRLNGAPGLTHFQPS